MRGPGQQRGGSARDDACFRAAEATPSAPPETPTSGAPPAPGTPVVTPAAKAAAAPPAAGSAASMPGSQGRYATLTLMVPHMDDVYGASANVEYRIDSMSGQMWTVTMGAAYEFLDYTKASNTYTQGWGMTMGLRPTPPMFLSFAVRAGATVTVAHTEIAGRTDTNTSWALLAAGDPLIGYVVIGVEAWTRNGSMWMLRGGASW